MYFTNSHIFSQYFNEPNVAIIITSPPVYLLNKAKALRMSAPIYPRKALTFLISIDQL